VFSPLSRRLFCIGLRIEGRRGRGGEELGTAFFLSPNGADDGDERASERGMREFKGHRPDAAPEASEAPFRARPLAFLSTLLPAG